MTGAGVTGAGVTGAEVTGAETAGTGVAVVAPGTAAGPVSHRGLDVVIVGWLTVLTMLTAVLTVFFLPWYVGVVPVPVSALVGAVVVYWAVRTCHRLTRRMVGAFAPALGWLAVAVWLGTYRTLGYGLVIGDWRAQLLLGLGSLGAAVGLGLAWGHQMADRTVPVVTPTEDPAPQ